MTLTFTYYSPTTPSAPGWSENLGQAVVRLGRLGPVIVEAQLGAVGISSLQLDDPAANVGHDGDAIGGLKQVAITESACPVGRRRIWTGYTGDRRYARGSNDSLFMGSARRIDATLVDLNSFLSFRIFTEEGANRPAETDLERIAWLLGDSIMDDSLFDEGLVASTGGVDMDAVDYRGQRPADLLNDCSQQSGRNHFVVYNETTGHFQLFYEFNVRPVYLSDLRVSNVFAEIDNVTTFAPRLDSELTRDPSRVAAGVLMPYAGGSVYRTADDLGLDTVARFGWRDVAAPSVNVKTEAKATARADRFLTENSSEDETLTLTLDLPRAHVNDWREGEAAQVKLVHLPGFDTEYRYVRAIRRTVSQELESDEIYTVRYECTPLLGTPSGAAHYQKEGVAYSGIPTLPRPTTPGNVLLALMFAQGNTTRFPTQFRAKDGPNVSPAPPEVLPFPTADGWTVIGKATTDYSGQNIGGPCGMGYAGPFHGGAGVCTSGQLVAAAWRYVQPGEVTTQPTQFSTELLNSSSITYLWELPTTIPPSGTYFEADGNNSAAPSACIQALPTITGNALAAFAYVLGAGHGSIVAPVAASNAIGEPDAIKIRDDAVRTQVVNYGESNWSGSAAMADDNSDYWAQIQQLPTGGVAQASLTPHAAYSSLNWCGLVIALPPGVELPDIPYPGNQSA